MIVSLRFCTILVIFALLLWTTHLFANNIRVENITLTGQNTVDDYTMVQFDISWDNSWRDIVNWDAAWVFAKYQIGNGEWIHVTLSINDGEHVAPAGAVINNGNNGGVYAPGVFIYRDANGAGSNDWDNIQLRWNYALTGVADDDLVTVKVFAIEMVYVPQGSFQLGDNSSDFHFYKALTLPPDYTVSAQAAINMNPLTAGRLWAGGDIEAGTSDASFPTGFNAFYCMKYEITQEQFVDFLNTLTRTQQNTRTETDISGTSILFRYVMSIGQNSVWRNAIRCDATLPASGPITFYCDLDEDGIGNEDNDGQNLACGYISWMDGCAYSDWAGLRPMTELEYEKACRGDQTAVAGEYAWGNSNIHSTTYIISNPGTPYETINGQPSGIGNSLYNQTGQDFAGPGRVGIFASSSTSRQEAGASYYGIMELTGNIYERTVTIGNADGRAFAGNHGGGGLSTNGNANGVTSWPGYDGSEVTGASGAGSRGSWWPDHVDNMQVSDREDAAHTYSDRWYTFGFRCVRTAP